MGRGGNQAEKQPQCQAQQTLRGAPELKGPICVTSFPLGPIPFLDVGYLGKVTTLGEPTLWLSRFLKGLIDSSRLSDDSTQSSWGYSPSLRKELGAASLCDHHTEQSCDPPKVRVPLGPGNYSSTGVGRALEGFQSAQAARSK